MKSVVVISEVDETLIQTLQTHLGSRKSQLRLLLKEFHNVFIKNVSPKPRNVHWSEEIKKHPLYKSEKHQVIEKIASTIKRGKSLRPYLSEKSDQLNHYDLSLSHYGVHHLHMGDSQQSKGARAGRVKGTKRLLFVRFTETDAYLLDILDHKMQTGFLNMHLFRIMHGNWPESIERFKLNGAVGVAVKYTDKEVAELLENDVNVIVEMGLEQVYMLPGMGTTTAGTPLLAERRVDKTIDELCSIVTIVKQHSCETATLMKRLTGVGHNVIRLKARIRLGLLDVYDASSGCVFNLQDRNLIVSVPDEF